MIFDISLQDKEIFWKWKAWNFIPLVNNRVKDPPVVINNFADHLIDENYFIQEKKIDNVVQITTGHFNTRDFQEIHMLSFKKISALEAQ